MYTIPVILAVLLLWFACGFVAAGYAFAYFQRSFSSLRKDDFYSDRSHAVVDVAFGAIALHKNMVGKAKYPSKGWLNPWGKKAKQEAGLI